MWLFYPLSITVGLIVLYGLVVLIVGITKIVALMVAIKGVPPENRAEVIRATGTMFKHEWPLALIGIRRKELSGREPVDGDAVPDGHHGNAARAAYLDDEPVRLPLFSAQPSGCCPNRF